MLFSASQKLSQANTLWIDLHLLLNIFLLFSLTQLVIIICNFFKIPHLVGCLIAGTILSPNTTSLLSEADEVEVYAEIDVILLLLRWVLEFSIGNLFDAVYLFLRS